jgi:hypothetical protein
MVPTILAIFVSTAMTALAAPPDPVAVEDKRIEERCVIGIGSDGAPTKVAQCLLFLLPRDVERPDLKRLEVIGTSLGADGVLLDQPQTVDATDRNVVVAGPGRATDGSTKQVVVRPGDFTAAYVNCSLILYEGVNNSGDSVCFQGAGNWPDLAWVFTFGSPTGWHDRASAYESQTGAANNYVIILCVEPLDSYNLCNHADRMPIPYTYPYALGWIDALGGSPNWPYTWNDRISGVSIY